MDTIDNNSAPVLNEIVPFHQHNGVDSPQIDPKNLLGFPITTTVPTNAAQNGVIQLYYSGSTYKIYARINNTWQVFSTTFLPLITAYFSSEVDNGNSGSAKTVDWTQGNKQKLTLSADCTITFTAPGGPCNLILKAVNFGAHTPTFSPAIKWPSGTAPTWTASGTDILALYFDGSGYYGVASTNFS